MKKLLSILIAAAMIVTLMAGCGSKAAEKASEAASAAASAVSAAAEEVKEEATAAASAATEAVSEAAEAATEAASAVEEAAEEATEAASEAAGSAAEAIAGQTGTVAEAAEGYVPPEGYDWPEMTIVVNDYNVPGSGPVLATDLACDYIEEVSGGKIKCERYYGGTLMEATDSFAGTVDGIADITFYLYTLNSGVSVVHNLFTNFVTREMPDMLGMLDIINNTIDAVPEFREEFTKQGLWEIVAGPTGNSRYEFKDADLCAKIKTPDDLKGLIVQADGYNTKALADHGVSGIGMPPSEWYTNLERGVVDALSMNLPGCVDFGLTDVTNGYLFWGNCGGILYSADGYFANLEKWNSWSPEVQALITAAFRKGVQFNSERDNQGTIDIAAAEEAAGKFINHIPEEEMQPWYDLGMEAVAYWKEDVNAMGLDADSIFEGYMAQIDKWFEENR